MLLHDPGGVAAEFKVSQATRSLIEEERRGSKGSTGRQGVPFCEGSVPRLMSSAESSSQRLGEAVVHLRDCGATASVTGQVRSLFKVSRDTKVCPTAYVSLLDHCCCKLVQVLPLLLRQCGSKQELQLRSTGYPLYADTRRGK